MDTQSIRAALFVVGFTAAVLVVPPAFRWVLDRFLRDPYVPQPRYRYRKGMHGPDVHLLNRIGQRRFDEVAAAQDRCTAAERLARRLAQRRGNVREFPRRQA